VKVMPNASRRYRCHRSAPPVVDPKRRTFGCPFEDSGDYARRVPSGWGFNREKSSGSDVTPPFLGLSRARAPAPHPPTFTYLFIRSGLFQNGKSAGWHEKAPASAVIRLGSCQFKTRARAPAPHTRPRHIPPAPHVRPRHTSAARRSLKSPRAEADAKTKASAIWRSFSQNMTGACGVESAQALELSHLRMWLGCPGSSACHLWHLRR
jgi:hypothetical protein